MPSESEKARRKRLEDQYLREEQAASASVMPLDRARLESLLEHVEGAVEREGCDHSRKATDAWASVDDVDLTALHAGLAEYGGYCDCEVVMDVHPDDVFEPVRRQRG